MEQFVNLFVRSVIAVAVAMALAPGAFAGKIDPKTIEQTHECRIEANVATADNGSKAEGKARFCTPKAAGTLDLKGPKTVLWVKGDGVTAGQAFADDGTQAILENDEYAWSIPYEAKKALLVQLQEQYPESDDLLGVYVVEGTQSVTAGNMFNKKAEYSMNGNGVAKITLRNVDGPGTVVMHMRRKPLKQSDSNAPRTQQK